MTQVSAHYTRNHFAEIIDMSQREPVEIAKHGRTVSILMSKTEYDLMRKIMDEWWMSDAHTDVPVEDKKENSEKIQRSLEDAKAGRGVKRGLLS